MPPAITHDLKTGYPHLSVVPRDQLAAITSELFTRDRPLQYVGDMRGDRWTREQVGGWLTETSGVDVGVPNLQITGGAISSTDQVCRYLTKPGDIVLVENPTFYFIIHKLELSHVTVMGVPMLEDGIDTDALEALCKEHGDRISMFYAIPAFHNPTGHNYSDAKRQRMVELAHQYDFTILEDATYQELYFKDAPPPMLRTYDPDSGRVISTASFAKSIMPSLRIGWIWATPSQVDELLPYKTTATSVFMSQLVGEMIAQGHITPQIARTRRIYGGKHDLMIAALREHAPDWFKYVVPNGGYFVWATLPDGLTATDVLEAANARGVDFAPGKRAFVREEAPDNTMRICFAMQEDEIVVQGIEILCEVLREMRVTV
ncbi:MAG: PLP-dependent aminotransferase family protein [Chloroflexota bacterium]